MKQNGVEEVPSNQMASMYPIYYMPHRPVVWKSSTTTRVRPVFDASALALIRTNEQADLD